MQLLKKMIVTSFITLFLSPTAWSIDYFNITLDPTLLSDVDSQFSDGVPVDPSIIDPSLDPNIHLASESEVTVSFVSESAGYHNRLGYITYEDLNNDTLITEDEITIKVTLFEDASFGVLAVGDSANLGTFPAGTNIGFWINPNGNENLIYYSVDSLNSDGIRRMALTTAGINNEAVMGFEDLPWNATDDDYDDVVLTFAVTPVQTPDVCENKAWHFNDENDDANNANTILYNVDTTTGVATQIDAYVGKFASALAADASGKLYALRSQQDGTHLVSLDSGSAITDIGSLGVNVTINSLVGAPDGQLYGFDEKGQDLYSIDPSTGAATLVHDYPKKSNYFSGGDLVFNENDQIVYLRSTGQVYVIDFNNPADIQLVAINPLPGSAQGHTFTSMVYLNGTYHPFERNDDAFYSFTLINGDTELSWTSIENVGPFSFGDGASCPINPVNPTPTPSVEPTPTPSSEPTPTPSAEPTPTPSSEPTPTPSVEPTPTPSESPFPNGTPEPTPTPDVTPTPSSTPTATATPVATPDNTTDEDNNTPGTSAAGNTPLGLFIEGDSKCSLNKSDGFNSSSTGFAGIALLLTSLIFIRRKHS